MRKVIGIGETVLDIIFRDNQPIQAVPGGSTFNSVISLGRAGVPVKFISEAGNDRVGRQIIQYLEDNGVDATNVCMFPNLSRPSRWPSSTNRITLSICSIRITPTTGLISSIPTSSPTT